MGLFDFLRRKRPDEPVVGADESAADADKAAADAAMPEKAVEPEKTVEPENAVEPPAPYEWDPFESGANLEFARGVLGDVSHLFGAEAKIVHVEDDGRLDLRGTYRGRPIRFAVWLTFGSFWSIEMRSENGVGVHVQRDPDVKPRPPAGDDPWEQDSGDVRVFVGKNTFLDPSQDTQDALAGWRDAPKRIHRLIVSQLAALDAKWVTSDESSASLSVNRRIQELEDPLAYFEDCAAFLAALQRRPDDEADQARFETEGATEEIAGLSLGHCEPCHALYPFDLFASCPNCKALRA